jgi:hypothetical protein
MTLALAMASTALAANRFSIAAGGNWSATATWATACGGAGGQSVPVAADNATICTGSPVTIDTATAVATAVTVNTGGTLQVTTAGNKLTTTGLMDVTGTVKVTNGTIQVGTFGAGATPIAPLILESGSSLTVGGGTLIVTYVLASASLPSAGSFTVNSGTVCLQTNGNGSTGPATALWGAGQAVSLQLGSGVNFTMSGGTIYLINGDNSPTFDLDIESTTSTITGGTIQIGDSGNPCGVAASVNNPFGIGNNTNATLNLPNLTMGSSQNVAATLSSTGPMTVNGTLTINAGNSLLFSGAGNAVTVSGGVTTNGTYTTNGGNPLSVAGDFTNNGTFNAGTSIVTFSGGNAQTLGGTNASAFSGLTLNKSANDVTMGAATPSPTVSGTFTLTARKLIMASCAANPVSLGTAGITAGGSATSYVQGPVQKNFAAAAAFNFSGAADEFPVGTASGYSPIDITSGTTSTAGNIVACVTATDDPNMTQALGGGIDTTKSVNRFWSMKTTTITLSALMDATFKFNAGDVDGGAATGNFAVERWDGTDWNPDTLVTAAATSTRVQNVGLTASGTNEFQIGEPLASFPPVLGTFNAFDTTAAAGAVIANIQTKQSGTAFSVRVVRIASNAVDTTYNQAGVTVQLYDSSNNTGTFVAVPSCRSTWSAIAGASVTVNFAAGVATATFTGATMTTNSFKDVRIHVVKTGAGAGEGCSTDNFAIRPASITVAALDATWQTAGTARALANIGATGGNVHAAAESSGTARPFTLRASPQPATATNYDGSPTVAAGFPVCCTPGTTPACGTLPATCGAGTLAFTGASWSAAGSGVRENATASYSEAGVINLQLQDANYAAVDANDGSSAATRTIASTATVQIGRFVPDKFVLAASNTPQYQTFGSACVSRSFTYIGQPFPWVTAPQALVTAVDANGTTTTNYRGALFKLVAADVTHTYTAGGTVPFDSSLKGTPVVAEVAGTGTGTVTEDTTAGAKFAFTRNTTTPDSPFTANISLTVSVQDAHEAATGGNGTISSASAVIFNGGGTGIAFDAGALFRHGIMKLGNALGSQSLDLPMPLQTQYWSGTGFVLNTADNCTAISLANVSFPTYYAGLTAGNMPAGNVSGTGAFTAGVGSLAVKKPTASVTGAVDVQIDLTAEAKTWLQIKRTTPPGTYTQNPLGRAAFGLYGSQPGNYIYFRENY